MIIPFLLLFISTFSLAGDRAGNGGDVLVCPAKNDPSERVVFLDSYEAQARGFSMTLSGESLDKKVQFAFDTFGQIDLLGRFELMTIVSQLIKDINVYEQKNDAKLMDTFFSNDELTDLHDSFEITIPTGCFIKQLIIFKSMRFSSDKSFIISKRYWDQLSEDQKAFAVIHEALYVYFFKRGWNDSRFPRYINNVINSSLMTSYGIDDFLRDAFISQKKKTSFLYLPSFLNNAGMKVQSLVKTVDAYNRQTCENSLFPHNDDNRQCLELELEQTLEILKIHQKDTIFKWDNFTLIPLKAVVVGQEVIGYQAIITTAVVINKVTHYQPIQYLPLGTDSVQSGLRWNSNTLNEIFENAASQTFSVGDHPVVFVNMQGLVEYIYDKNYAITL
jgi:hypothetical protein